MDKIDLELISLLQENARAPLKQLAAQVFLSSPATGARIERLERDNIITGYSANINYKLLGYPIVAFVNLEVQPSQKPLFYPFIEKHPNVMECNCVTGHYSMLIKVAFKSTENLDIFIGQLQTFGHTETQIVFSTVKDHHDLDLKALETGELPQLPDLSDYK